MSHSIDLDGILEKLVLLQHYSLGSKSYCEDRSVGSEKDIGDYELDKYWGWTKGIVSNFILECSIKQRVIQDTFKDSESMFKTLDKNACEGLIIGEITKGNFELTLRESCNKIIHAVNVVPSWNTENPEFHYWSGKYHLTGMYNKLEWKITLDIYQWAKAYEKFIELFESTDEFHDLGQDFIK